MEYRHTYPFLIIFNATAGMTLSSFSAALFHAHLTKRQACCSYPQRMKHDVLCLLVDAPDISVLPDFKYDWEAFADVKVYEEIPVDVPVSFVKHITILHHVDTNLFHDVISYRSDTEVIHLVNQTTIEWHSKKQVIVQAATCGFEYCDMYLCGTLIFVKLCGVLIRTSYMLGVNKSFVDSPSQTRSKLHKHHTSLYS